MIVVVPYPEGVKYIPPQQEDAAEWFARDIVNWANECMVGIWELDMLQDGVRIRFGNPKDSMMLALKFGVTI